MSDGRRLTIRRLEPGDDRSGLDSGQIELDRFFQRFAGQNQFRHHLGVTDAKPEAVAFYRPLGFQPLSVISGALGDHPEPIPMFLPVQAITKARQSGS